MIFNSLDVRLLGRLVLLVATLAASGYAALHHSYGLALGALGLLLLLLVLDLARYLKRGQQALGRFYPGSQVPGFFAAVPDAVYFGGAAAFARGLQPGQRHLSGIASRAGRAVSVPANHPGAARYGHRVLRCGGHRGLGERDLQTDAALCRT